MLWLNFYFIRFLRVIFRFRFVKRKVMFRISIKFVYSIGKCKAKMFVYVFDVKVRFLVIRLF